MSGLKNLETLICKEITSDFKLNHFKRLTRLELCSGNEEQLQVARGIREERRRLGRDDLEMLVSGFKENFVFSASPHPPIFYSPEYFEYAVQNHSDLVSRIPWELYFNVSTLLRCANSIPADFFNKFPAIKWIHAFGYDELITESERSSLIELIKRSNTKELHVDGLKLKSEFYDRYPPFCR